MTTNAIEAGRAVVDQALVPAAAWIAAAGSNSSDDAAAFLPSGLATLAALPGAVTLADVAPLPPLLPALLLTVQPRRLGDDAVAGSEGFHRVGYRSGVMGGLNGAGWLVSVSGLVQWLPRFHKRGYRR